MISQKSEVVSRWVKRDFKEQDFAFLMRFHSSPRSYYVQSYSGLKFINLIYNFYYDYKLKIFISWNELNETVEKLFSFSLNMLDLISYNYLAITKKFWKFLDFSHRPADLIIYKLLSEGNLNFTKQHSLHPMW